MNALIQEGLIATKHVSQAAIVQREGLVSKAKSNNFEVKDIEMDAILSSFQHPREARENGLSINNKEYQVIRADMWAVYAKNMADGGGLIVGASDDYFIVAFYDATMFAAVTAEAVERLSTFSFLSRQPKITIDEA